MRSPGVAIFIFADEASFMTRLITVPVSFVAANLEIGKEALNRFLETDAVLKKFVLLKIVFEIRWRKPAPVHQPLW